MRNVLSKGQVVFAGTVIFVLVVGVSAIFSKAEAGGCLCPLIYAPVTCDHNKTYPNQCEADCHHAKNCVPSGVLAAR
jgi:hypothetical protein